MASSDWPDYTHAVVLTSAGNPVTDCPDWQEQVVAPGGDAIATGSILGVATLNAITPIAGSGTSNVVALTCTNTAPGWANLAFALDLHYSTSGPSGGVLLYVTGDLTYVGAPYGFQPWCNDVPGVTVAGRFPQANWAGPVYLSTPDAVLTLVLSLNLVTSGSYQPVVYGPGNVMTVWQ